MALSFAVIFFQVWSIKCFCLSIPSFGEGRCLERIRSLFIIELDKLQFTGVAADHGDLSGGGYKDVCHELGRASIAVVQLDVVLADQARFPLFVRRVLEHKEPGVRMVGEDQNPGGISGLPQP